MAKIKKTTNEWEFQGQVLTWLNDEISRRPGWGFDKATQEPSKVTPKRSDLVVWTDRVAEVAFLSIELKTPETRISDPELLLDGETKAKCWKAPYFAIWNMQIAELMQSYASRSIPNVLCRESSDVMSRDASVSPDVEQKDGLTAAEYMQEASCHCPQVHGERVTGTTPTELPHQKREKRAPEPKHGIAGSSSSSSSHTLTTAGRQCPG